MGIIRRRPSSLLAKGLHLRCKALEGSLLVVLIQPINVVIVVIQEGQLSILHVSIIAASLLLDRLSGTLQCLFALVKRLLDCLFRRFSEVFDPGANRLRNGTIVIPAAELLHLMSGLGIFARNQSLETRNERIRVSAHHENDRDDNHPEQDGVQDVRVAQRRLRVHQHGFQAIVWVSWRGSL